jgi:hypothetical protein
MFVRVPEFLHFDWMFRGSRIVRAVHRVHLTSLDRMEKVPGKRLMPIGPLFLTKIEKLGFYHLVVRDFLKLIGIDKSNGKRDFMQVMVEGLMVEAQKSAIAVGATHILKVRIRQDVTRFWWGTELPITFVGMMHMEVDASVLEQSIVKN